MIYDLIIKVDYYLYETRKARGPVAAAPQPAANPAQRNRLILQRRGRRTRCQVPLQLITDTYNAVSENVQHTGCGLYESLDNNNVKRGYWRGIRPVAEAMLVDPGRYRDSLARHGADLNMQKARSEAAVILNSSTGQRKLQLYVDGLALQPFKKY